LTNRRSVVEYQRERRRDLLERFRPEQLVERHFMSRASSALRPEGRLAGLGTIGGRCSPLARQAGHANVPIDANRHASIAQRIHQTMQGRSTDIVM